MSMIKTEFKKRRKILLLYKNKYSLLINDFISFHVANYYNVECSLFQYMSMYVLYIM